MDNSLQLQTYIQQARNAGLSDSTIKTELLKMGWEENLINECLRIQSIKPAVQNSFNKDSNSAHPHKTRNGVLWILSPFIILITVSILQFVEHIFNINVAVFNIIALLAGIAGLILLFVGPLIGIIKLSKR